MPTTQLYRIVALSRGPAILEYIHQHYRDNISMEDIRAQLNVNEKACRTLVKQVTGGQSLHQYHEHFRLAQAFNDVIDPNQIHISIAGIAETHGYSTVNYFIRVFKKEYGLAPHEYREKHVKLVEGQ